MDSINFTKMTLDLPEQFQIALDSAKVVDVSPLEGIEFTSIIVLGMGGSGVSGDVVSAVASQSCKVPVIVCKNYELPEFVNESTLVIAASYSGTTEETLSALRSAQDKKAPLVAVCSGGELESIATNSLSPSVIYKAPAGLQPRASMGALVSPIMVVLDKLGLIPGAIEQCEQAVKQVTKRRNQCQDPNEKHIVSDLVTRISTTIPVIYGGGALGAVAAYRFKCDVNENAKTPAYWHYYPELNHNEIVGYGQNGDVTRQLLTLVELRHDYEHAQVKRRFDITRELIKETLHDIIEVNAEGTCYFAQLCDLMYIGSLASLFMALNAGVDPGPVDVIWELKNALA
ncbi:MAG: bifunctional phosphoglucose/phosphomannose isomerase [Acidimicrobiia bacterium]